MAIFRQLSATPAKPDGGLPPVIVASGRRRWGGL